MRKIKLAKLVSKAMQSYMIFVFLHQFLLVRKLNDFKVYFHTHETIETFQVML